METRQDGRFTWFRRRTLVGEWEKNLIIFYICIWIHAWVETRQDGRFTCFQRNVEDAGGPVGKNLIIFILVFGFTHGWRQGKMGDLPGFGGLWRMLVGEREKNLIIFIFVFGLMGGDRARWEIYLVSEECR